MKKFKIFLLLSILLCFGFVLNSEVYAQSNGPKVFEEGDILPATTQLRISWTGIVDQFPFRVQTDGGNFDLVGDDEVKYILVDGIPIFNWDDDYWIPPYNYTDHAYIDINTSTWNESKRTISFYTKGAYSSADLFWEDLNPTPTTKKFEVGDILPVGNIKISWDFTDKPILEEYEVFLVSSGDDFFNDLIIRIYFNGSSNKEIEIFNGGSVNHFNADTPGFTIITLTGPVTITNVSGNFNDYNVYVGDALTWEVVSEDYLNGFMEAREIYGFRYMGGPWMSGEAAWNHGYDLGSEDAWDEGFEYGTEMYGYYDPITDQWLSVEEYLELYGTDKLGQSDFYNNFDKYFIPAMIIVFGGAIVLTILKVFKGRE